jgi:hypothetical protein
MNVCNKLECLSLAGLCSLVKCLWESLGAYLRVDTHEHYTYLERLVSDKLSSLLQTFVNNGRKNFTTLY